MPSIPDPMQLDCRIDRLPRLVQVPCAGRWCAYVVASLHNHGRNALETMHFADQLSFFKEPVMGEIVILNAGKGQRKEWIGKTAGIRSGQQGNGAALPCRPGSSRLHLHGAVIASQSPVIRRHQVVTFICRDRRYIILPKVGINPGGALLVKPADFLFSDGEDTPQHQLAHALRMPLRVGQCQRAAPRTAKYQPLAHSKHDAQPLDVGHQIPSRVVFKAGVRL